MDKIYYNGKIYSLDVENRQYSAVGIQGDKIAFLGSDNEAQQIEAKERINLHGATMLPGFIDSHLHMLNYAFVANAYGMFAVDSIARVIEEGKQLAQQLEGADPSQWLYGRGWNHQNFTDEKRLLTRHDLDQISTTRPILFIRVCGHAATVNSKALEIVKKLPDLEQYREQIDEEAGVLTEAAVKLCYNTMETPAVEAIKELLLKAQADFNRRGITSVQSDNFLSLPGRNRQNIVQAQKELAAAGRLTVRIREQASFTSFADMKEFIDDGYRSNQGDDFYAIGPVKLYQDGSLGANTALLHEPYTNAPSTCGLMLHDEMDLQNCVDYAYRHDMQILIHSIGDRASDMVMDAYEETVRKYGAKDRMLAINHLQIVSPGLFDRMKKLGVMAFIQPVFVASDKGILKDFIGEEREKTSYAWKTMQEKGLLCCGSSDSPVENYDVLEGIQIAVTRARLDEVEEGWLPQQKLSVLEALRLFTINNAYSAFEENKKGTLEKGKLADLVVLAEDPFQVNPHRLAQIKVLRTVVGGKDVYDGQDG